MRKPPLIEVEWDDARTVYEQMELSAARLKCRLTRRYSLGYLVAKDKDRLVIAHTFDPAEPRIDSADTVDEDHGADFTVIPRGWVKAIVELTATNEPQATG